MSAILISPPVACVTITLLPVPTLALTLVKPAALIASASVSASSAVPAAVNDTVTGVLIVALPFTLSLIVKSPVPAVIVPVPIAALIMLVAPSAALL